MSEDRSKQDGDSENNPAAASTIATLSKEQGEAAVAWLGTHIKHGCPSCGTRSFTLAGLVHVSPWLSGGILLSPAGAVPLLLVVCNECALTQTYSAVRMGLVKANGQ